jgi:uncharacterized protein YdhG (YjbR/CyaY superfamily)
MTAPAKNVDDYLASVPATARATLKKIRKTIKAAAPNATEKISYGMPSFYYLGPLVTYAAFRDHCSFFPMSTSVMDAHKARLKDYDTSKGTIRFAIDTPLPSSLVTRLVKARIVENEAKAQRRAEKRSKRQ